MRYILCGGSFTFYSLLHCISEFCGLVIVGHLRVPICNTSICIFIIHKKLTLYISCNVWVSLDPSLNETLENVKDEECKKSGEKNRVVEKWEKGGREDNKVILLLSWDEKWICHDPGGSGALGNGAIKRFQEVFGEALKSTLRCAILPSELQRSVAGE